MRKFLTVVMALSLSMPLLVYGQVKTYGSLAESLQNSAHQLFYNPDGPYYNQNNGGNAGFNYWWQAQALDALLDGYARTKNEAYKQRMKDVLVGIRNKNGGSYPNYYYDDMEWLGIASLRAYQNTGDPEYLDVTNIVWQDIKGGRHPERGGAIQWNKGEPWSFNACANAPGVILAARVYKQTGNAEELDIAKSIYAWMKNALVDSVSGAVWDNYNTKTGVTNKKWIFSYNVGTWIGAGLELYRITGDKTYLQDAIRSAEYAMTTHLTNGVFWTNEDGGGDGGLFKGIFIRYFAQLAREGHVPAATRDRYVKALKSSAKALKEKGINPNNKLVNANWTTRPGATTDYSSQLSGIMLMEAAAAL